MINKQSFGVNIPGLKTCYDKLCKLDQITELFSSVSSSVKMDLIIATSEYG